MKKIFFLTIGLVLLVSAGYIYATVSPASPTSPGSSGVTGPSALYTSVDALWDFEEDGTDSRNNYDLACGGNCPDYSNVGSPETTYGSYHASFVSGNSDDYSITNGIVDVGANNYSISFWVNFGANTDDNDRVQCSEQDGDGMVIRIFPSDGWDIRLTHCDAWACEDWDQGWTPAVNTWYHVVISWVTVTKTATMWVTTDGQAFGDQVNGDTDGASLTQDPADGDDEWFLGSGCGANFATMLLDEMVWWKGTAISAADAEAIYDGGWR